MSHGPTRHITAAASPPTERASRARSLLTTVTASLPRSTQSFNSESQRCRSP